jgi:hypothetical protein
MFWRETTPLLPATDDFATFPLPYSLLPTTLPLFHSPTPCYRRLCHFSTPLLPATDDFATDHCLVHSLAPHIASTTQNGIAADFCRFSGDFSGGSSTNALIAGRRPEPYGCTAFWLGGDGVFCSAIHYVWRQQRCRGAWHVVERPVLLPVLLTSIPMQLDRLVGRLVG